MGRHSDESVSFQTYGSFIARHGFCFKMVCDLRHGLCIGEVAGGDKKYGMRDVMITERYGGHTTRGVERCGVRDVGGCARSARPEHRRQASVLLRGGGGRAIMPSEDRKGEGSDGWELPYQPVHGGLEWAGHAA